MTSTLQHLCGDEFTLDPQYSDVAVYGLSADSREIEPGFVFAALPGSVVDGADYIKKAVGCGAVAIVARKDVEIEISPEIAVIKVDDPRAMLAKMAAVFYGSQPDCVAAVTGTNGKSSVVAFVRQIWETMGLQAASLGTVGISYPGGFEKLAHTTPDPVSIQESMARLADMGVKHLALEASSHGLEQRRLDGLKICVGAFTNFTQDHLDYHKTFEAYFAAKMRLFDNLLCAGCVAVVNDDCDKAPEVREHVLARGSRVFSVGRAGRDLKLLDRQLLGLGQTLKIKGRQRTYTIYLPLVGEFQASNALVAAGMVIAAGGSEGIAIKALEDLKGARGRLDLVDRSKKGAAIFVDYAHTPDALETALGALKPFAKGRLIVVFGCGGNRDKGKRPLMGEVAQKLADKVYLTDDNPRNEDAGDIRAQAKVGCPDAIEIGDRRKAIVAAIGELDSDDVLLITGKGHEEGQIVGDKVIPFSDHEEVLRAIAGEAA